jgi:glycerol-3-phosphate dehydrogenase
MMERDYQKLKQGPFDVLVIGGGIYGAWVAYDAALRGMKVALVEKHDWAAGTSSASSKLIHGGLRYLEYSRFGLVRKGLDERKRLWELGPHRVRPLRFVMPLYAGSRVGRMRLKLGLWLYDRLARGEQPVPPHEQLTGEDLAQSYDFLETHGLRGGFTFGDCVTDDARLTLEIVDGAQENANCCRMATTWSGRVSSTSSPPSRPMSGPESRSTVQDRGPRSCSSRRDRAYPPRAGCPRAYTW